MDRRGPTNYRLLARIMTGRLADTERSPAKVATDLGRRWGPSLVHPVSQRATPARSASLTQLVSMLDDLGFRPEPINPARAKEIRLRHCPFLDLVDDQADVVCALHLGLTEAGLGSKGIVATTAALSVLLQEGIGDTIRASLTPLPNGDRTDEVIVSQQILQSLGIRNFSPQVTACPGCGRTTSTFFQDMADQIQTYLRESMPAWKTRYEGVETMKVAVMGCIVNGPGESKHANIGISLPGTFEEPVAPVYIDGKLAMTLRGDGIVPEFIGILNKYIDSHYSPVAEEAVLV